MKNLILGLLFFIIVLIEGLFTTLPLFLISILIFHLLKKGMIVYLVAFSGGILLDIFSVRTIGQSSLFFVFFLFFISLYERKFEVMTFPFVIAFSFLGSLAFLFFQSYTQVFQQALVSCLIAVLAIQTLLYFNVQKSKKEISIK